MTKTTLILSALMMLGFVLVLAPGVLAMNRGKVLRNIAIWLAVMAVLGFIYKNFGPGSKNPIIPASPAITAPEQPKLGHEIEGAAPAPAAPAEEKK
jgi:hypothetical protein